MPRHAIETGHVDATLPTAEIADAILEAIRVDGD